MKNLKLQINEELRIQLEELSRILGGKTGNSGKDLDPPPIELGCINCDEQCQITCAHYSIN
jgi:hypothetical protein